MNRASSHDETQTNRTFLLARRRSLQPRGISLLLVVVIRWDDFRLDQTESRSPVVDTFIRDSQWFERALPMERNIFVFFFFINDISMARLQPSWTFTRDLDSETNNGISSPPKVDLVHLPRPIEQVLEKGNHDGSTAQVIELVMAVKVWVKRWKSRMMTRHTVGLALTHLLNRSRRIVPTLSVC